MGQADAVDYEALFPHVEPDVRTLLVAALELFAALGYNATTTRKIAKAVGKGPSAVYNRYTSKHEVLLQIVESGHLYLLSELAVAKTSFELPDETLAEVVRTHVDFHARYTAMARVANYELLNLDSRSLARVIDLRKEIEAAFLDPIRVGQASKEFRTAHDKTTATCMMSMGIDVARWYRAGGRMTSNELANEYAGYALRLVGVDEQRIQQVMESLSNRPILAARDGAQSAQTQESSYD